MTSAKIFKWERKTDEHGGVARGKEIVHTSVHIDSDHKEKERPNGQRLNGEATNKWGEEKCCTEKDIGRRSQIGRGRVVKEGGT